MAMLRAGAYSKKFQSLEKERARQLKEQEKANRSKAQLYSKQTALRQKALEEKKKAMVIAEEDRRRKALEERRVAQKEATKRFRSALSRIRSSTKGQGKNTNQNNESAIDFYLPDKPKPKSAPTRPKRSTEESRERVALGKDVEIKLKPKNGYHPQQVNRLQRRTPSLDDVLGQIRGERAATHSDQEPPVSHGRILVHKRVPEMFPQQGQVLTMGKRSSSDPNLVNKKVSSNDPHSHTVDKKVSSSNAPPSHTVRSPDDGILFSQGTSKLHRNMSDENIVFKAVHSNQHSSKMDNDLRVMSPDIPVNFSNESLLSNTVDAPPTWTSELHDSLDTARPHAVFTIADEEDSKTQRDSRPPPEPTQGAAVSHTAGPQSNVTKNASNVPQAVSIPVANKQQEQPVYTCESDVSSIDSLEDQQGRTTPSKSGNGVSIHTHPKSSVPISRIAEQLREAELLKEAREKPKVVGILKKSSTASMTNRTRVTESAKAKRVRFADRIESSSTEAPTQNTSPSMYDSSIDPARIELWKRVLPNGVTNHYLPNSAFTPKMRVSLTSKPSASQPVPSQQLHSTNGLTVYIPVPSTDSPPSPPRTQTNSVTSKPEPPRQAPHTQPKVSTASVGLNGVTPNPPNNRDASQEMVQLMGSAHRDGAPLPPKKISLEKTPTDDEITSLWDQIRNALEDNQKVLIPPQVFNFRIEPSGQSRHSTETASAGSVTSQTPTVSYDQRGPHSLLQNGRRNTSAYSKPSEASLQKGAMQRQTNLSRPVRNQPNFSPQPAQLLGRRGHSHSTTYPVSNRSDHMASVNGTQPAVQMASTEPDLALRTSGRKAPTALSVEEKRLMLSIENLNHKIKDHMGRHPSAAKFQTPISPEPPDFIPEFYPYPPPSPPPPQMHRITSTHPHSYTNSNGHVYNLPKTRNIRRNPKTAALATAVNPQAGENSRTYTRAPAQRFYNT